MAEAPSADEMWRIIQEQQKVIEELKAQLQKTDQKVVETREEVEAAAEAIEVAQETGTGGASWADKTSLGGYGELHYNSLNDQNADDGTGDDDLDRVDFHRFVLFIGHEFNEDIRLFSEIEIEHSLIGDGDPGAVELEQAWIEMDLNDSHRVRAGLDILPIGFLNQVHEPNTFYGVERNKIETEIIPTTWWEAGISLIGELAPGWNYDLVAHSGLAAPTTGSSAFRPRSGRLKVAEADDTDLAFTGRLRYTGIAGLEVGVSGQYQRDYTSAGDLFDIPATLFEGHVDYKHSSGLALRALYARWDIDDDSSPFPGAGVDAVNADELSGWYVEPSYRTASPFGIWGDVGVFVRYSQWDERNRIGGGHRFEEFTRWVTGINWWPHDNVVFKFDYQNEHADDPVDRLLDGVNLGVGFQF
ncbi:MAG: OprO/OprP family phosphate-selective porin [Thiotrichales bacterium]|nr:OprO/OprP family phosphate-selective porin [Thiotrichales bacterium]